MCLRPGLPAGSSNSTTLIELGVPGPLSIKNLVGPLKHMQARTRGPEADECPELPEQLHLRAKEPGSFAYL